MHDQLAESGFEGNLQPRKTRREEILWAGQNLAANPTRRRNFGRLRHRCEYAPDAGIPPYAEYPVAKIVQQRLMGSVFRREIIGWERDRRGGFRRRRKPRMPVKKHATGSRVELVFESFGL